MPCYYNMGDISSKIYSSNSSSESYYSLEAETANISSLCLMVQNELSIQSGSLNSKYIFINNTTKVNLGDVKITGDVYMVSEQDYNNIWWTWSESAMRDYITSRNLKPIHYENKICTGNSIKQDKNIQKIDPSNKELLKELLVNAINNDYELVLDKLLDAGIDPDMKYEVYIKGEFLPITLTPVMHAAGLGHVNLIKVLLDHGADINKTVLVSFNRSKDTPIAEDTALTLATSNGDIDTVKFLLDHGAHESNGWHAINAAATAKYLGYQEIYQLLQQPNSHIHETKTHHTNDSKSPTNTPLIEAVVNSDKSAIGAICSLPTTSTKNIASAYWKARDLHNYDIANHLYSFYAVKASNEQVTGGVILDMSYMTGKYITYGCASLIAMKNNSKFDTPEDVSLKAIEVLCDNSQINAGHAVYLNGQRVCLSNMVVSAPDIYLPPEPNLQLINTQLLGNVHYLTLEQLDDIM